MESSTGEPAPVLSYKQQRYDRQLRLWGDHGQHRLERTSVCLINSTGTGAETMKNLVLPGIGTFIIVDSGHITGPDFESNFFTLGETQADSFNGRSRAEVVCQGLLALNPDVQGRAISSLSLLQLLDDFVIADRTISPTVFFQQFGLVILCDPSNEILLLRISDILWQLNIPLLVVHTTGMVGLIRLQVQEHIVEESHPDYGTADLRLEKPLQAFISYAKEFDLAELDNRDHAHVPWLVILYKALDIWRSSTHREDFPTSYADKKAVRLIITALRRGNDEENFREAEKAVNTALQPSSIPAEVQRIFDDAKCRNLSADSDPFWIVMHAVSQFVAESHQLPLSGELPDMTATSDWYLRLQQIYRDKAIADSAVVHAKVIDLMQKFQFRQHSQLTFDFVRYVSKHAAHVRVLTTTRLSDELLHPNIVLHKTLLSDFEGMDAKNALWYKTCRRYQSFVTQNQRVPTITDIGYWNAAAETGKAASTRVERTGNGDAATFEDAEQACWHEMCRFGGETLYSVRAFVGGIAGQEAIKLITRQYVPMREIVVCNGIECAVSSFQIQCLENGSIVIM